MDQTIDAGSRFLATRHDALGMGGTQLDKIAEHIVVLHLEVGDPSLLCISRLQASDQLSALVT